MKYEELPAIVRSLDPVRGDLFIVITDNSHYAVRAGDNLEGEDSTIDMFVPGVVGVKDDEPVFLRLLTEPDDSFVPCEQLTCTTTCPKCAALMRVEGHTFKCLECMHTL